VVLIDQMLHVNGMQDQLGTVNRGQARRKRWFAHYPQSIAISALVTVIVLARRAISSQLPVAKIQFQIPNLVLVTIQLTVQKSRLALASR
jgi:hypothetical protein